MSKNKYDTQEIMQKFNAYRSYKEAQVIPDWRLIHSIYAGKFWEGKIKFSRRNAKAYLRNGGYL